MFNSNFKTTDCPETQTQNIILRTCQIYFCVSESFCKPVFIAKWIDSWELSIVILFHSTRRFADYIPFPSSDKELCLDPFYSASLCLRTQDDTDRICRLGRTEYVFYLKDTQSNLRNVVTNKKSEQMNNVQKSVIVLYTPVTNIRSLDSKRFWRWCIRVTGFLDFVHRSIF